MDLEPMKVAVLDEQIVDAWVLKMRLGKNEQMPQQTKGVPTLRPCDHPSRFW